ncbi:MAG: SnoaL-like domain-containing protein [Gammaproteobacteria bacterium]|nr:SnoaL-like domain-containing protein [Gammaproteobacteria bacterium]
MSDYETAVQIVDSYMTAMSSADYAAVVDLYADNATLEDPVGSGVKSGKAAISEFYHGIGEAGLRCTRSGPVRYANQELVFPFVCEMPSPDGTLKIEIIDHFVLDDDNKVAAMRAFWGPDNTSVV